MDYPRVLVIAPVKFNQETGSGVTMGNLFRGWPVDSLAQIHSDKFSQPDETVCRQYFYLPYYGIRAEKTWKMAKALLSQTASFWLHRQETLAGHFAHLDRLLEWSRQFAPDVIYARPLDRPSCYIWIPLRISQVLRIPYITRVLDDWPARSAGEIALPRRLFWRYFLRQSLRRLFDNASANLAISDEMCAAFHQRYEVPFIPFSNCIETAEWEPIVKDYAPRETFQLVYLGTVTPDKELDSLIDLREVVLALRQQGYPVQLTIYGPPIYRQAVRAHLESPPGIVHGGYFPSQEKARLLSQADLLVLPINFSTASQAYAGYSFQTKLPEYLASGSPVLVYGPPGNPNVRYATREGWGLVVDRPDKELLAQAIVQCYHDQALREKLGRYARSLAFQNHAAATIRPKFQQLISDVAHQQGPRS